MTGLAKSVVEGVFQAIALACCLIFVSWVAFSPLKKAAERGWFEHEGKVYRVVPAEVR